MATEVWPLEGIAVGAPDMVANSLAARVITSETAAAAIQAVTDNLPDSGSLTDLADIKTVTDNLPDGGSLTDLADIKTVTDNLPDGGSLTDLAGIKAITDNLPDGGSLNDLATIEAVTSNLPNSGALTDISAETDKIDGVATDGLNGVLDSLAYRVHEIETHLHANERWFGAATAPNGEIHVADRIGTTTTAFQSDAGNDTWGSWLQIIGSSDTPADTGMAYNDLQRLSIVAVESANATHFVQVAFGTSGAAGLGAGDYSELAFRPQSVQGAEAFLTIQTCRHASGMKIWLRHWTVGQNTSTMSFFFGLHEYEG